MPVTDFECQIARSQIGRYLSGEALSSESMRQLDEHIADCPACKELVAERRAALMSMLGGGAGQLPTHAVVSVPVARAKNELAKTKSDATKENPVVAAIRARYEAEAASPSPSQETRPSRTSRRAQAKTKQTPVSSTKPFAKPIALGGLLAVILVGMSYANRSNNGQGVFGPKAASIVDLPSATEKPTASPETPKRETPAQPKAGVKTPAKLVTAEKPATEPKPTVGAPAVESIPAQNDAAADAVETPTVPVKAPTAKTPEIKAPIARKPAIHPAIKPVHRAAARRIVKRRPVRKARTHKAVRATSAIHVYAPE